MYSGPIMKFRQESWDYPHDENLIAGCYFRLIPIVPNAECDIDSLPRFYDKELTLQLIQTINNVIEKRKNKETQRPTLVNRINSYNSLPWYKKLFKFKI